MKRKVISIFLMIAMLLSLVVPAGATADEDDITLGEAVSQQDEEGGSWVNFRVIGSTEAESKITSGNDIKNGNYHGAEYQTWFKTTKISLPEEGMKIIDFCQYALSEAGFTYTIGKNTTSSWVNTPAEVGSYTLKKGQDNTGDSAIWMITTYGAGQTIPGDKPKAEVDLITGKNDSATVSNGDTVVVHFTFYKNYETYGKAQKQKYLYAADLNPAELVAVNNAIALIDAIGDVGLEKEELIVAARAAYTAAGEALWPHITNYAMLEAAEADLALMKNAADVEPPVFAIEGADVTGAVITLKPSVEPKDEMTVQYRISADGITWDINGWQASNVFTKLKAGATYYFQARYKSDNPATYKNSDGSNVITVSTAAAEVVEVRTRDEWFNAITGAALDGSERIIKVVEDIVVNQVGTPQAAMNQGTNITVVGAGGMLIGSGNNGCLDVGSHCTLTLKDLTFYSIFPDFQSNKANVGCLVQFTGTGAVMNLENVDMYADVSAGLSTNGILHSKSGATKNTLNIYSGNILSLIDDRVITGKDMIINLLPKGDIIIEGEIKERPYVTLIPQEGYAIKSGSIQKDTETYTALEDAQLVGGRLDTSTCYGLRIIVSENGTNMPQKLDAPQITAEDFTIEKVYESVISGKTYVINDISVDYKTSAQDENAVMQIRWRENKSGVTKFGNSEVYRTEPFAFDPIPGTDKNGKPIFSENTEYIFHVRFKTFGGNYADSDPVELIIKSGYIEKPLVAPTLLEAADKTENSITMTPVAASAEDEAAVAMYRVSKDQENWSEWQESVVFENLDSNTTYYFQACYSAHTAPYADSPVSNTIEAATKEAQGVVIVYGDVDGDGVVTDEDVSVLRRYLAREAVEIDETAADANGDTHVTLADLVILVRYVDGEFGYSLPYIPEV